MKRVKWIKWSLLSLSLLVFVGVAYGFYLNATLPVANIGQDFNQPSDQAVILAENLGNSAYCGHCHTDLFQQWNASLHSFSSHNNPVYRKVTEHLRQQNKSEHLQFCARCHEPIMLVSGESLQAEPDSWVANSGLTCLSCHRIIEVHGGNGQYVIKEPILHPFAVSNSPWLQQIHAWLVQAFPWLHRQVLTQDLYKSAEYCQSCHSVTVPAEINGQQELVLQDEYEQWTHSPFAHGEQTKNYPDCHMPLVPSDDPAAKKGVIRSHRFTGGNTAIPRFNSDFHQVEASSKFLQDNRIALKVLNAKVEANSLTLDVEISSKNIGHAFPAGTADSNQAWLAIEISDSQGQVIATQGALDEKKRISDDAMRFGIEYIDAYKVK